MKIFSIITLGLVMAMSSITYAHEKRFVSNQYEFIVGFAIEPAFSDQMNGVDLRVSLNGVSVEGAEKELQVTVLKDGKQKKLEFHPKYKDPGRYMAYFWPTKAGQYIFHIQGKINGIVIDETFSSGEKFHDVEDSIAVRFP